MIPLPDNASCVCADEKVQPRLMCGTTSGAIPVSRSTASHTSPRGNRTDETNGTRGLATILGAPAGPAKAL